MSTNATNSYQWFPVGNPLGICGAGEGYMLYGKRPGHVALGDRKHRDVRLAIEWDEGGHALALAGNSEQAPR